MGSAMGAIGWRVARSMSLSMRRSRGIDEGIAQPLQPGPAGAADTVYRLRCRRGMS